MKEDTTSEVVRWPFVCPYHGRIASEHVTTMKTCGRCMEQIPVAAGNATTLHREPYQGHDPRHKYDCGRCKFAWNCGPQCHCPLVKIRNPPRARAAEVKKAEEMSERARERGIA